MKQFTTALTVIIIAISSSVYGQADFTKEGVFTTKGKVISDISVTKKQDLDLGIAIPGQNNSIVWKDGAAEYGGTGSPVKGPVTRGVFQIDVTSGVNVGIEIEFPNDLLKGGVENATDKIRFQQAFSTSSGRISSSLVDTWSEGENYSDFNFFDKLNGGDGDLDFISDGNSYTTTVTSPTDGVFYLVMAAAVYVGDSQAIGNYSNNITLTATIQN